MRIGARVGHYEVVDALGRGGMGEVWRARDSRLGRDVAIKTLPEELAGDEERLARIEREARVLASLNHPGISAIHGLEESEGGRFLVLELVEGETLAERIARGPVPVEEALALAFQIAEGLEAAHEAGVVHRDLKPANVKVTADGRVKLLDFGLAKALEGDGRNAGLSNSPTLSLAATEGGVILGTAAYMSPEQAKGQPVDKRTDIFAFGCVLFELLAGRRAFVGDSATETLAAVIRAEPDLAALPPAVDAEFVRLLRRCLEKDPLQRMRDVGDVRLELARIVAESGGRRVDPQPTGGSGTRSALPWLGVGALGVSLFALAAVLWNGRPEHGVTREVRLQLSDERAPREMALSPDGRRLVFRSETEPGLSLLEFDALAPRPLVGTEGARNPFWSPDGRQIAFFTPRGLELVDLAGGRPRLLSEVPPWRGSSPAGTWSRKGVILFGGMWNSPLYRVAETGGVPEPVLDAPSGSYRWPQFLPDGRRFIYLEVASRNVFLPGGELHIGDLETTRTTLLLESSYGARYAEPGFLLHPEGEALVARALDLSTLELAERAQIVAQPVAFDRRAFEVHFSVSERGLAMLQSPVAVGARLLWLDRSGRELGVEEGSGNLYAIELSPDGSRLVLEILGEDHIGDLFVRDLARGTVLRLTRTPRSWEYTPKWSPDGRNVAFVFCCDPGHSLRMRSADGSGRETLIAQLSEKTGDTRFLVDWSPDGELLLFRRPGSAPDGGGLFALRISAEPGERAPELLVSGEVDGARISPDGRWLAYASNETGRYEVYLRPLEGGGSQPVSNRGGRQITWGPDGTEFYYVSEEGELMAAPFEGGRAGRPSLLFKLPERADGAGSGRPAYSTADGQRFLVNSRAEADAPASVVWLEDWRARLEP